MCLLSHKCDFPECQNEATLLRCPRCAKHAACEKHSYKQPQFSNRYLCFICNEEIKEAERQKQEKLRQAKEADARRIELAKKREQERTAQYSIICPVCGGTGGWDGVEEKRVIQRYENNSDYKAERMEKTTYFEPCYLCNTTSGVKGKITSRQYQELERQGLTYSCPHCINYRPYRTQVIKVVLVPSDDEYVETLDHAGKVRKNCCQVCEDKRLVTDEQYHDFIRKDILPGSQYRNHPLPWLKRLQRWWDNFHIE